MPFFTLRLRGDNHAHLAILARTCGMSMNDYVNRLVENKWSEIETTPEPIRGPGVASFASPSDHPAMTPSVTTP